jgi:hypothetical protein
MRRILVRLTTAATLAAIAAAAARTGPSAPDDPIKALEARYPSGAIYVTYISLNNMRIVLHDPARFPIIEQKYPVLSRTRNTPVIEIYKGFLRTIREGSISQAVAFLWLDFRTGKAGFKRLSDYNGLLQDPGWTRDEVVTIAQVCDEFLTRFDAVESFGQSLKDRKAAAEQGWRVLVALRDDPHIPREQLAPLVSEYRALLDAKAPELAALQATDPKLAGDIEAFKEGHDRAVELARRQIEVFYPNLGVAADAGEVLRPDQWEKISHLWDQAVLANFAPTLGTTPPEVKPSRSPLWDLVQPKAIAADMDRLTRPADRDQAYHPRFEVRGPG